MSIGKELKVKKHDTQDKADIGEKVGCKEE